MPAIEASERRTSRLRTHVLTAGSGEPLVLLHGNLSDGSVWREQLELLPEGVLGIAPDLRGFGRSEPLPIDATRGVRDLSDDVLALLDDLGIERAHVAGHSAGAGVAMQLALDAPERVRSLVLVAPVSPYGYGGTRLDGTPCAADFAGAGGGAANPELVQRIADGDRSADSPLSPRSVIRTLFFPTPEAVRDEELILDGMLATRVGDDHYPGDSVASAGWPGVAPGERGILNAIAPRWFDAAGLPEAPLRAPVLWVRGDVDAIVSEGAMTDLGHLGAIGAVPGWPGEEAFPAQPMIAQTRAVLARYEAAGRGPVREVVLDETGHFPFTQRPDEFAALLREHLTAAAG